MRIISISLAATTQARYKFSPGDPPLRITPLGIRRRRLPPGSVGTAPQKGRSVTDLIPALLALEDGSLWPGRGFGAVADATGEIVFNTSLTGYQEILTDPSYHRQLVTMTAVHIGNTGVNPQDEESDRIWAAALIVRDVSPLVSNWRAREDLSTYLARHGIPGITDVETRALVRHIRERGAMRAALSTSDPDPERLIALAQATPDMTGSDLVREVTCDQPYDWQQGARWWQPTVVSEITAVGKTMAAGKTTAASEPTAAGEPTAGRPWHVVAYDYGIKRNILHQLAARGCRVTVVPATTSPDEVLALEPDGIFLSNGPGDPAAVTYAIENVRELLGCKPLFGICLGHQILALALGAQTFKLKFGHRGGNQPVQSPQGGRVEISAHNHGFAVDPSTLPKGATVAMTNLNDGCCEGLAVPTRRAFSVQYHPESSPGPHDSERWFDRFVELMAEG